MLLPNALNDYGTDRDTAGTIDWKSFEKKNTTRCIQKTDAGSMKKNTHTQYAV